MKKNTSYSSAQLVSLITQTLDADKAQDIVQINLRGKSEIADYIVVCTGSSSRHISALADNMVKEIKKHTDIVCRIEGRHTADWVLMDVGDVVVHLFRPEVRAFYQLEKMWMSPSESGVKSGPESRFEFGPESGIETKSENDSDGGDMGAMLNHTDTKSTPTDSA